MSKEVEFQMYSDRNSDMEQTDIKYKVLNFSYGRCACPKVDATKHKKIVPSYKM
jgi:hypothetical protein